MVGVTGFEPAAPWSQTKCATGLRYTPTKIYYKSIPGAVFRLRRNPTARSRRPSRAPPFGLLCSALRPSMAFEWSQTTIATGLRYTPTDDKIYILLGLFAGNFKIGDCRFPGNISIVQLLVEEPRKARNLVLVE